MYITFIRPILYRGTFSLVKNGTRKGLMTTPRKMKEVLEDLEHNPYYDKYANKIKQLQKADPEQFTNRVQTLCNKPKPEAKDPSDGGRQFSQLLNPKAKKAQLLEDKEESLEKIMKIDLIKDKTPEEIKTIWEQYHLDKDLIVATIPAEQFEKLNEKSKKYPTFLFPVPRSQGYEFMMCQFDKNKVHFTPLLYYQVHKENAPECLTMAHYTELKDEKGIVLMRGEFDKDVINAKEAQCLANQIKLYYIDNDPVKENLLHTFTNKPDEFKHNELIKQIESLSL